jgi:hypothetical protein
MKTWGQVLKETNDDVNQELLSALKNALRYLDHPEVKSIPFALPVTAAIKRAQKAIDKAEGK